MNTQRWTEILSRITQRDARDIDDLTGPFDPRSAPAGRTVFPDIAARLMPRASMKRPDAVCIGLRVEARLADAHDRALRLAAFALERDVEIIVLAHSETSGLERFGMRMERIAGDSESARSACEDQVRRFWNIDLVL